MKNNLDITSKIYKILQNYNGKNSYLIDLKNGVFAYKNLTLNDFHIEYILKNHDKEPVLLNKIIKISKWYGEKKKEDWNIDFIPEKLLVSYFLGETDTLYHMYVKYRKSQDKMIQVFIPKKAIITPLFLDDFKKKEINFDKYNKLGGITIKPQQELGVKFLTTRKKCILALNMGGGKSLVSIVSALEDDYKKVLIVCPASLKTNWANELYRFVSNEEVTIVEGSKWKENKFTIINYDILDNFYEIPTEIVNRKEKYVDDNGKVSYKTIQKEVVSKKESIIKEAMNNSQLFQSNFDLIIIDEAHKLSNSNSIRYKVLSDLIKRSNPKGIYELTGTMITNNPMNLYNILKIIDADITKDWQSYVKTYCDGKQIYRKGERDKFTNIYLKKIGKSSWYDLTYDEKEDLNVYLDKNCRKLWLTNGASNLDELSERIKHLYFRDMNEDIYKHFSKDTTIREYILNKNEQLTYNDAWDEYVNSQNEDERDIDKLLNNKKLIEGSILRQVTSQLMVPYTIRLVEDIINNTNDKVIVFCAFDKEIYSLQEHFHNKCVVHNGKLTPKEKDKVLNKFNNDDNCRILFGNLTSTSVGLNLISANHVIFNSVSWLPAENQQAEYRILRIGQTKDCHIVYQKFINTYQDRMFEILKLKNEIIDNVVLTEDEK